MKSAVMDIVGQHFRPEFINRIDEAVVFKPLSAENIRMIAGIQIKQLAARLEARQLELSITDAALDRIGSAGFDPVYGARPLKREIQQQIENPLAQRILAGDFVAGDTVYIDSDDDSLTFSNSASVPSVAAVH